MLLQLSFHETLINTILDKGLLGLLIVAATFAANRILENYKSTKARDNEILKMRIAAMTDTWETIYSWVTESNQQLGKAINEEQLSAIKKEIQEQSTSMFKTIEKNRFLTGDLFVDECHNYAGYFYKYFLELTFELSGDDTYYKMRMSGANIINSLDRYLDSVKPH